MFLFHAKRAKRLPAVKNLFFMAADSATRVRKVTLSLREFCSVALVSVRLYLCTRIVKRTGCWPSTTASVSYGASVRIGLLFVIVVVYLVCLNVHCGMS